MIANLPGGRSASPPLGAMFWSKDSLVVAIDMTHAPCNVMKPGVQILAIHLFHSCGIVLFHGIDGQLVRFSSKFDGNTRSTPSSAPERAHATPAPPSYNAPKAPKSAVLLVTLTAAHALYLRVRAGFLGPYVSLETTRPPYELQHAHLAGYKKKESALLAHDFKYGDAAFDPLHRDFLALEKILPAQDPDVEEHEQPIVQPIKRAPPGAPRSSYPSLSPPSTSGTQRRFLSASASGTRRQMTPTPPRRRQVHAASRRCPRPLSRCLLHCRAKQPPS